MKTAAGLEITIEVKQSKGVTPPLVEATLETRMLAATSEKERQQAWIDRGQNSLKAVTSDLPVERTRTRKRREKRERDKEALRGLQLRCATAKGMAESALSEAHGDADLQTLAADSWRGMLMVDQLGDLRLQGAKLYLTQNLLTLNQHLSRRNVDLDPNCKQVERNVMLSEHGEPHPVKVLPGTVGEALDDESLRRSVLLGLLHADAQPNEVSNRNVVVQRGENKHHMSAKRFELLLSTLCRRMPAPVTTPTPQPELGPAAAGSTTAMDDEDV